MTTRHLRFHNSFSPRATSRGLSQMRYDDDDAAVMKLGATSSSPGALLIIQRTERCIAFTT